jgi:hypothetical protein
VSTQIGRLTFEDRPEVYDHGTGTVTVSGAVFADSLGKAEFYRRQIVALADSRAEKVIPLIVEDGFEGFVRVDKASADAVGGSMGKHWFRYSVTAVPVLGADLPVVETVVSGALRSNALSITTDDALPFHAVPGSRRVHEWPDNDINDVGDQETRTVEGGTVDWQHAFEFSVGAVYRGVATWVCEPDDWYEGACGVERLVDGEYLPVVAPGTIDDTWLAENGLVRFGVDSDDIRVSWFGPDGWSTPVDFVIEGASDPVEWIVARVARFTPDTVSVVLTGNDPGTKSRAPSLTCTIRRGSPWVDCRYPPGAVDVHAATATAATDVTYGMRRTTAVDGWNWLVISDVASTINTGSGILTATSGALSSFGIGAYHSSWTGNLALGETHKQWYAAQSERTVIGNRL